MLCLVARQVSENEVCNAVFVFQPDRATQCAVCEHLTSAPVCSVCVVRSVIWQSFIFRAALALSCIQSKHTCISHVHNPPTNIKYKQMRGAAPPADLLTASAYCTVHWKKYCPLHRFLLFLHFVISLNILDQYQTITIILNITWVNTESNI